MMSYQERAENLSPDSAERIIIGSFIGAFSFLVYDFSLTFADEVQYVWTLPNNYILKWIFFWLRYITLASQFCHQFEGLVNSRVPLTTGVCRTWYLLDVVTMESVLLSVELVLMLRVYLLYRRALRMAIMLCSCLVIELIVMATIITITLPKVDFNPRCLVSVTVPTMAIFGAGVLVDHILVLGFTLFKGFQFWRDTYTESPLLPMVVRDGMLTFLGLMCATTTNVIIYAAVNKSLSIIGSPWIISIMSTAGCRIILNIEMVRSRREPTTAIELTTNIFGVTFETDYY